MGLGCRVALVDLVNLHPKPPMQLARKAAGSQGVLVLGSIRVERHADDQRIRLPFTHQTRDGRETVLAGHSNGAKRLSAACERVAAGDADTLLTEIECKVGAQALRSATE